MNKQEKINFVFFGTPDIAVWVLEELKKGGVVPSLIITAPDKPAGRKIILTPPPAKIWAEKNNIPVLQPEKLDDDFTNTLNAKRYTLFIIAAYGKIIPQEVLDVPKHGTLNVHPSLLPKFRGASPIISAILSGDKETGTTIMLVDAKMDHGPIVAQESIEIGNWNAKELGEKLARLGGQMLTRIIPKWLAGEIKPKEQEHDKATYTKKITKEDGYIDWQKPAEEIERTVRAFCQWPGAYSFWLKNGGQKTRLIITGVNVIKKPSDKKAGEVFEHNGKMAVAASNDALLIERVKPEGKNELSSGDFLRGNKDIIGAMLAS